MFTERRRPGHRALLPCPLLLQKPVVQQHQLGLDRGLVRVALQCEPNAVSVLPLERLRGSSTKAHTKAAKSW